MFCLHCGIRTEGDAGGYWWAIPGLLLPPVGIVLFCILRKKMPISARTALTGSGVGLVFYACYLVV